MAGSWGDDTSSSLFGGGDWFDPPPVMQSFQLPDIKWPAVEVPSASAGAGLQGFQMPSWMNAPNVLGGAGALAGLGGALGGLFGGQGGNRMSNFQKGGISSASGQLGKYAQGQTPFQQMQMDLLKNIASGQGLPQGYAQNIETAFQPQMGDLYSQAANMGRSRGFHDAPATSPAGGAILGPGLSNLQGQIAAQKLAQMMALPGLFNSPIQMGLQGAVSQGNLFANLPANAPKQGIGQIIGTGLTGLGGSLAGMGQGIAQQQQQTQQNTFQQDFLKMMQQNQARQMQQGGGGGGYQFNNYIPNYQMQNTQGMSNPMGMGNQPQQFPMYE